MLVRAVSSFFFFFNDTATTEIYTLSLHDALPICDLREVVQQVLHQQVQRQHGQEGDEGRGHRSEEHTSELQSPCNLVCRLLLEKKKRTRAARRQASHMQRPASPPSPCRQF